MKCDGFSCDYCHQWHDADENLIKSEEKHFCNDFCFDSFNSPPTIKSASEVKINVFRKINDGVPTTKMP